MNTPLLRKAALCALIAVAPLASSTVACAQAETPPASQDAPSVWQKRVLADETGKLPSGLPYRVFLPKGYDGARKYPVIVYLHGSGERGTDNQAHIEKNGPPRLVSDAVQGAHPCIVVAPQCPPEMRWTDWTERPTPTGMVRLSEVPSEPMRLLLQLVDRLPRELAIDARRVYLTGVSMGGMGTWELLSRRPKLFAAAVPICGRADLTTVPLFKHVPEWIFHGDADDSVSVQHSRSMAGALKIFGAPARYTEYPGVGHNSWDRAYDEPELFPWLFAQSRP